MSIQESASAAVEEHPLSPFLPAKTRLLMLGSFPPARRRWCMEFFYPNYINDMWRIFGLVFFGDKDRFVDTERRVFRREDIIAFLNEHGVGLYDTACAVRRSRNTASDKDLEVVRETDLDALLDSIPCCTDVITTGQKATDIFTAHFGVESPKVGSAVSFSFRNRAMRLWRMPSSSRAYPMKVERKAAFYRDALGILM